MNTSFKTSPQATIAMEKSEPIRLAFFLRQWFCTVTTCAALLFPALVWSDDLTVLTYHDITADPGNDVYAVSRSMFVAHMDYLQTHGYQPISLSQLEEYREHPERMPAKAVMLTFDDGLTSYYKFVLPVLKTYQFPSVASVVTGWMDGKNTPPEYFGKLMSWDQLREISQSPLVEIVSHTHDLHHGIQSNPQGSQEAASVTRQYYPATQRYESEETYRQRIQIDLQHSIERLHKELGIKPRAVTWPYGQFDNVLSGIATDLGLRYQFSLQDGPTALTELPQIHRIMLMRSNNIEDFINELSYRWMAAEKKRFAVFNLDPFTQAESVQQQEQLFSGLLDRLEPLHLNMVVLSAFSSDNAKTFFATGEMPLAADVLRRAVHLLRTKLRVRHVYLHLPAKLPGKNLSPVYGELARLVRFDGAVFDADIDGKTAKFIQKMLSDVHPNLQYGVFGTTGQPFEVDFVIATVDTDKSIASNRTRAAQLKGINAKLYLLGQQVYDIDNFSPTALNERFQALDVQNYGFQLNTAPLTTVLQKIDAPESTGSASGAGG
ncbi:MAG: poly-beta-1,6-N-acetyl-D-glucosamine N-deacetylase PgaB [Gammaproteobacteria bacterium]|jgi:biofilm PGA synthesis lipoprotein PgaB